MSGVWRYAQVEASILLRRQARYKVSGISIVPRYTKRMAIAIIVKPKATPAGAFPSSPRIECGGLLKGLR